MATTERSSTIAPQRRGSSVDPAAGFVRARRPITVVAGPRFLRSLTPVFDGRFPSITVTRGMRLPASDPLVRAHPTLFEVTHD
jgi:hypothetical protein